MFLRICNPDECAVTHEEWDGERMTTRPALLPGITQGFMRAGCDRGCDSRAFSAFVASRARRNLPAADWFSTVREGRHFGKARSHSTKETKNVCNTKTEYKELSFAEKVSRLGTRLAQPEWRRYGGTLLLGKISGVAIVLAVMGIMSAVVFAHVYADDAPVVKAAGIS